MHFSARLVFLPALALCLPQLDILPTAESVTESVININNAVLELDAIVQNYTGGSTQTTFVEDKKVLSGVGKIHDVNRQGFHRAIFAKPFSVEDTVRFIDTVVATGMSMSSTESHYSTELTLEIVNITIPNSIQNIRAKKPIFKETDSRKIVIASLVLLLYDHDTFSASAAKNFNPRTPRKSLEQGTEAAENIHDVIQDALLYYTLGLPV